MKTSKNSNLSENKEFFYTRSFTGRVDRPIVVIQVSNNRTSKKLPAKALLDTGSNKSAVTKKLADSLRLPQVNTATIVQGSTKTEQPVYLLTFILDDIVYKNIQAIEIFDQKIPGLPAELRTFDVLIGMDIIGTGNFLIESASGDTRITFKVRESEFKNFI